MELNQNTEKLDIIENVLQELVGKNDTGRKSGTDSVSGTGGGTVKYKRAL